MERGLAETPYGYIHYTKHLVELKTMARNCEGEVIAGARFCATWSHADQIAQRTIQFIGKDLGHGNTRKGTEV